MVVHLPKWVVVVVQSSIAFFGQALSNSLAPNSNNQKQELRFRQRRGQEVNGDLF